MNLSSLTSTKSFNSGLSLTDLDFYLFCFEYFNKCDFDKIMRHLVGVQRNNKLFLEAMLKMMATETIAI